MSHGITKQQKKAKIWIYVEQKLQKNLVIQVLPLPTYQFRYSNKMSMKKGHWFSCSKYFEQICPSNNNNYCTCRHSNRICWHSCFSICYCEYYLMPNYSFHIYMHWCLTWSFPLRDKCLLNLLIKFGTRKQQLLGDLKKWNYLFLSKVYSLWAFCFRTLFHGMCECVVSLCLF